MNIEELTWWLNAVVDAQTEYETIPLEDRTPEPGVDGPDEYWGFFRVWRDDLTEAAWEMTA